MKTFFLQTFGCKLNQADSAAIRAALKARGLSEVRDPAGADLIVVNTCSVTSRADRDARSAVRRFKRDAPAGRIFVTGCYAEHAAEALAGMPEVDEVFGLAQRRELYRAAAGIEQPAADGLPLSFEPEIDFGGKTRAFLKVQEGCDQNCSYCVVRLVRGRSRSLPSGEIITRLRVLATEGFNEIVLTGTHLGHWGRDTGEGGLPDLLRLIDARPDLPRIRLCSLEPFDECDEVLEIIAGSSHIAQHLHLAVQSGSARILEAMRRTPDPAAVRRTAERARRLMPLCGIGADIIVGFPGESDEDFDQTLELMTGAPFTYAHVFAFSPRPGTDAAGLPNSVHSKTIKQRSAALRARMAEKNYQFRKSLEGVTLRALALSRSDRQGRRAVITDNYIHVTIEGVRQPEPGKQCKIEISAGQHLQTTGVLVDG